MPKVDSFISISLSMFLLIGNFLKTGYSSYGLSALAFWLLRGSVSSDEERKEKNQDIQDIKTQLNEYMEVKNPTQW